MSDPIEQGKPAPMSPAELENKVSWEGGAWEALIKGLSFREISEDTEAGRELRAAWMQLQSAYMEFFPALNLATNLIVKYRHVGAKEFYDD